MPAAPAQSNRTSMPTGSGGLLSRGVSIKGSVKFRNELLIDGEIRVKSVNVRGSVEGDIFATERCELQAGCTLRGDIETPRLVVDENVTFFGCAKVAASK